MGGKGQAENATPSSFLDQVYLSLRCAAEFSYLRMGKNVWGNWDGDAGGLLSICMRYVKASPL